MAKKASKKSEVSKAVKSSVVAQTSETARAVSKPKPKRPAGSAAKVGKAVAKPATARPKIAIDHPSDGDKIGAHHYTVRISCSGVGGLAEISINGDSWLACREAVGYRWFDWGIMGTGAHTLRARLMDDKGSILCESAEVVCEAK